MSCGHFLVTLLPSTTEEELGQPLVLEACHCVAGLPGTASLLGMRLRSVVSVDCKDRDVLDYPGLYPKGHWDV